MAHNIDFDGLENTTMLSANIYQGTHDGHIVQVFDMPSYSNLNPYYLTHSEKSDWIAFNKLSIKSGSFRWIADLQVRNVNYMSRGTTQDGLRNFDAHYFFFNPKFGVNYTIDSRHKIYLFSGIGQKEPNRNDFTDASQGRVPKPEKMFNIEIGHNFRSKEVLLENNFYAMLYQDQLVQTGAVNDVGAYIRQNVDKSYRLGWEQRFEWQVVPKFRFKSSQTLSVNKIVEYTYTIPAYNVDYTININATSNTVLKNVNLAFSPSWISYLELAYQPTKNLTMTLPNKSVSSQYLDNTASDLKTIPFYNFLNLSVEQKIHPSFCKEIRFNLLLNNLLNHLTYTNGYTYNSGIFVDQNNQKSTPVDYNYVYPQAGFNVMMGIHMGF
jgi:iron complex outermembrane receptor protein